MNRITYLWLICTTLILFACNDDKFEAPKWTLSVNQSDFHIEGTVRLQSDGNQVPMQYTASALTKEGGSENLLRSDTLTVDVQDGSFVIANEQIDFYRIEPNCNYQLTLADNYGTLTSASVTFGDWDEMSLTIATAADSTTFALPLAQEELNGKGIMFLWGDSTNSEAVKVTTAANCAHIYATAGERKVTIRSTITDRSTPQIPEFNFGKYPVPTLEEYKQNANGELLKSVDTPILRSAATNLGGMLYGTDNLASIHEGAFSLYADATDMTAVLCAYNAHATVPMVLPKGLFTQNTLVERLEKALWGRNIASVPDGFFAYNSHCWNFKLAMGECYHLKLSSGMFIDPEAGITEQTRFAALTQAVDFTNLFYKHDLEGSGSAGTSPEFWKYTFGKKFTWKNACHPYVSGRWGELTNYNDIMGARWAALNAGFISGGTAYPYN